MKLVSPTLVRRALRPEWFLPRPLTAESESESLVASPHPEVYPVGPRSIELLLQYPDLAAQGTSRWLRHLELTWNHLLWHWHVHGAAALKRAFDIAGSSLLLLLLSPLFFVIGLLVKLEDRGPVFFAQTRVGRHGREFKMYKIRSMCMDAEARWAELVSRNRHAEGVTFKIKDDPRITRVGYWLRKFSLDELPQFFNVLLGDMSLVGPRPPLPREVRLYTLADHRRLAAKPGITCFWQVSGRSEIDFSGQVKLDVDYIEQQSFWVDLKILARTLPAVVSGKGAC